MKLNAATRGFLTRRAMLREVSKCKKLADCRHPCGFFASLHEAGDEAILEEISILPAHPGALDLIESRFSREEPRRGSGFRIRYYT